MVVGIGSSECSHTGCNPFTSGERVHLVEMLCPSFDVVFSNNPFVERRFEEAGYEVYGTSLHNRKKYRGAEIRRRMLADESWEYLVPDPV